MNSIPQLKNIITALLIIASLFIPFSSALAFRPCFGKICFGGKITFTMPCECQGALFMAVGLPAGGTFIIFPGTRIFAYGAFIVGNWTLGNAAPALVSCIKPVCKGKCCPTAQGFPVIMAGTSATP